MTRDIRMLLVDTSLDELGECDASALPGLLDARDLLVVNDAATLPASLMASTADGRAVEVRLLEGPYSPLTRAVLFGAGDYRIPTEHRPHPPVLRPGEALRVAGCELVVNRLSALSPRLVELRWSGDLSARFELLYRAGRPVQYSYVPEPLALWDVQTSFATRPWSVEMPSAARPLRGQTLLALARRGVRIARITHAAGLSATGDAAIDAALPLPERYEIPPATLAAIAATKQRAGRVIAVGTTVVRALEDSARRHGGLRAGEAVATLVLDADSAPVVVDGLLSGVHTPDESHYRLLSAFVRAETLARAAQRASERGFRVHEFGDATLLLPGVLARRRQAA